ncbi:hypothetical protein SELMODRAFT_430535 [Selaginella moellendorffii]|uniref:Uncharacterized protein n=1 Tax=Selaginella moellendorffii TaxID=88036 RepID=D8T9Q0_SELML|nr:hypothetical protein SELMODRAFT_430535 [Selaginella moellendorffii]
MSILLFYRGSKFHSILCFLSDKKRKAKHKEGKIQGDLQSLREDISSVEIELLKPRQAEVAFSFECPAPDCPAQEHLYNRRAVPSGQPAWPSRGPLVKKKWLQLMWLWPYTVAMVADHAVKQLERNGHLNKGSLDNQLLF